MILIPIIFSVLVAGWFYKKTNPDLNTWQKNLLWFLRSCSLIIIMLLLFNPILAYFTEKLQKPQIVLLHDTSESMKQQSDNNDKSVVLNEFRTVLQKNYSENNYEVSEFSFANGLDGEPSTTNLGKSIGDLLKTPIAKNLEKIYLFSDGWLHEDNLDFLDKIDIPISTFDPQFRFSSSDLEVNSINFPQTTYKKNITPFSVYLTARNYSKKAKIQFKSRDKIIASKILDFSQTSYQNINFEHSFNNAGLQKLQFIISADSLEEINTINNALSCAIQVLENRRKCLIISDELTWDIRFLQDSMKSEAHWETDYLQKQRSLKKVDETVQLTDELSEVNTLILFNNKNLRFSKTEAQLITNFVASGGGLIMIGKAISDIREISPARELDLKQTFTGMLTFTNASTKYKTFRALNSEAKSEIPPVDYYYVKPQLGTKILAEIGNEQSSPAIIYSELDNGKILQCPFINLWKWQLRSQGNEYRRFISDLIVWLGTAHNELFYAYTRQNSYYSSEKIKINLAAYDETMTARQNVNAKLTLFNIKEPNKTILEKYLINSNSVSYAIVDQLDAGEYSFVVTDEVTKSKSSGNFIILPDNLESRDYGFNSSLLDYIAQQTDGDHLDLQATKELNISQAKAKTITYRNEIPIYKKWYVIAIFLFCFCLELYLRKRWGLL